MADSVKCPKCGADNPASNKFCDTCGYKLAKKEQKKKPDKEEKKKEKKPEKAAAEKPVSAEEEKAKPAAGGFTINWEVVIWLAILVIAVITRFYDLGAKPMHHDESMHAFYSWNLFMGKGYAYNPMMHGPFLFHANAFIYYLFGTSDYTARVMPAIYGMLCVGIIWWFRPYLGKWGAVITAFLIAISPTFMYQARYIRNDIYIAGDNLIMVLGLFRYFDTKKFRWLVIAAVGLALAWATKEVTYITGFIFFLFFAGRWLWEYSYRSDPEKMSTEGKIYPVIKYWTGKGRSEFLWAFLVFFLVHAFFYFKKLPGAGFFTNLGGVFDGYVKALTYWLGQHEVERGSQPWYFYALLIPFYEHPSVFFMLIASVYYIVKPEKRTMFNLFLIWWWVGAMFLYSWAGERMPWLALHPLTPMILLAGKFTAEIFRRRDWGWKRSAGIAVFIITCMGAWHGAVHVCFYGAGADPKESLVYVQSSTDTLTVEEKIRNFAKEMKGRKWESSEFRGFDPHDMRIVVEDYCTWPFAWYLREFNKIAYHPKHIPAVEKEKNKAPIILSGIEEANKGHDRRVYELLTTPGEDGTVYVPTRYKLREWWAPDENKWWDAPFSEKIEMLKNRLLYREVWNDLGSYDFVVYVRKDLEKYWR